MTQAVKTYAAKLPTTREERAIRQMTAPDDTTSRSPSGEPQPSELAPEGSHEAKPLRRQIADRWNSLGPVGKVGMVGGIAAAAVGGFFALSNSRTTTAIHKRDSRASGTGLPEEQFVHFQIGFSDMDLVAGEYVFACLECDGDGSLQVIDLEGQLVWERCFECHGEGVDYLDEEEAAERIDSGYTPLRTPIT
ncbi:hypothetical protein [Streptomyces sp. M92]|uniref:hypothetical protein n=1 Tax=Streptomyces sp. M92 TaxID=2944250 RepID=UPI00234A1927|nr:hypothetical protein [Streptomyces sp. M92]WCN03675.1 hypothetical protein M6G08_17070 [Streptomyces sp. M92]